MQLNLTDHFGENRRKYERKVFYSPALLFLPNREPVRVRTFDISADGMGVVAIENLTPKAVGVIQFTLPAHKAFDVRVRLVHTIFKSGEGFKVGLQFIDKSALLLSEIQKFIKS